MAESSEENNDTDSLIAGESAVSETACYTAIS